MKTRIVTLGYYEDLNAENLHYTLEVEKDGKWEKYLHFFDGSKFTIDGVEITTSASFTKKGQPILTLNYQLGDKFVSVPLFNGHNARMALTYGALQNGLFHNNKKLTNLEQCLVDNEISIRSVRYVQSEMELDLIFNNIDRDHISPLLMRYLNNNKIEMQKLIPKEYTHSTILPVSQEDYNKMKKKGFLIIEKITKETEGVPSRRMPSIIFVLKDNCDELIKYINAHYALE